MNEKKRTRLRHEAFALFDRGGSPGNAWRKLGCSRGHTYTLHSDWEAAREKQREEVEQRERGSIFSRVLARNAWRLTEGEWLFAFIIFHQIEKWMFDGSPDDPTAPAYLEAEAAWREAHPGEEPTFEPGFPESFRSFSPDTRDYRLSQITEMGDGVHAERFMKLADAIAGGSSVQLEPPRALRALVKALWPAEFGTISEELRDDLPTLLRASSETVPSI